MPAWLEFLGSLSDGLFDGLVRASIQGGVFILLVWLVSRLLPRLSPSAKCLLWWLASLKLLVAFVWVDPLPIPVLDPPAMPAIRMQSTPLSVAPASEPSRVQLPGNKPRATPKGSIVGWNWLVVSIWAAILVLLLAALEYRGRKIARIAGRAAEAPEEIRELASRLAEAVELRRVPEIRVSFEIDTPLVCGFRKPVVLLPAAAFARLGVEQQRMALCHELLHVKRKDLWLGWVPALAERLFFFHPLAHLAAREYQLTREAACDAAVIRRLNTPPRDYGRLLLTLGVSRLPVPVAAAGSPSSYSKLKRRITMLGNTSNNSVKLRIASGTAVLLAAFAITPLTFVARSQNHLPAVAQSASPESTPTPVVAPAHPGAPVAAALAPVPPAERRQALNYVLFLKDDHTMMSASSEDVSRARSFRKGDEEMMWFRRGAREYVVRDPAVLEQAQEVFRPLREIGGEQAKIGGKQAEIGGRQAEIGKKQAAIGGKQAEIGAQQARVGARQAEFEARQAGNDNVRREELENERQRLTQEMEQLGRQMQELGAQMQELNGPMGGLHQEMDSLSERMNGLSRKMQEASAKAEIDMSRLLDRAISNGTAKEVK